MMRSFKLKALVTALVTAVLLGGNVVMADTVKTIHPGTVLYPDDTFVLTGYTYMAYDDEPGGLRIYFEPDEYQLNYEFDWSTDHNQWVLEFFYGTEEHPCGLAFYLGYGWTDGTESPVAVVCTGGDGSIMNPYAFELVFEDVVPMYRLYNPNSGEHFYTAYEAERNNLISLGWNDEGVGWYAPALSVTPVYRLYNSYAGEHHYTTDLNERNNLMALGWDYEDIGWYSDDDCAVPLYRQYNPNEFANNHNYTTSLEENDHLVSLGWRAEDIGWYGINIFH